MKTRLKTMLAMASLSVSLFAQTPSTFTFEEAINAPEIQWTCPDIEKYQGLLNSLYDRNDKVYATKVMEHFGLYADPASPDDKRLITLTKITIDNPYFDVENLLNHIASWIKNDIIYNAWGKSLKIEPAAKKLTSQATVSVAYHSTLLESFTINISPTLYIQLIDRNHLLVSFVVDNYKLDTRADPKGSVLRSVETRISEVFPFDPKSSYKNSYAKAYVKTYQYFWTFINQLRYNLNTKFTRDLTMLAQMQYANSRDSLKALYGEPAKIFADNLPKPDINKEIHIYDQKQKIFIMGTTIDFNSITKCEITDDPKLIPGQSYSLGLGLGIFGLGFGGSNTYKTPDKIIHNYVVKIDVDSLKNPIIYIATGENKSKADELAATIDYIIRHR